MRSKRIVFMERNWDSPICKLLQKKANEVYNKRLPSPEKKITDANIKFLERFEYLDENLYKLP